MARRIDARGASKRVANESSAARVVSIGPSSETPRDFIHRVMRDSTIDIEHRIEAAKIALNLDSRKKRQPKLVPPACIEVKKPDWSDPRVKMELARRVLFLIAKLRHEGKPVPAALLKLSGPDS